MTRPPIDTSDDEAPEEILQSDARQNEKIASQLLEQSRKQSAKPKTKRGARSEKKRNLDDDDDKLPDSILNAVAKAKQSQTLATSENNNVQSTFEDTIIIGAKDEEERQLPVDAEGLNFVVTKQVGGKTILEYINTDEKSNIHQTFEEDDSDSDADKDELITDTAKIDCQSFTDKFLLGKRHPRSSHVHSQKGKKRYHKF